MKKFLYVLFFIIICAGFYFMAIEVRKQESKRKNNEIQRLNNKKQEYSLWITTNDHSLYLNTLKIDSITKNTDFEYKAYADLEYSFRYYNDVDLDSNFHTRAKGQLYINKDTIVIIIINKK